MTAWPSTGDERDRMARRYAEMSTDQLAAEHAALTADIGHGVDDIPYMQWQRDEVEAELARRDARQAVAGDG
jgi:hypothetical protein